MTTDLEDRLRADLPRLADLVALDGLPPSTNRRRNGHARAIAVAALCAALVAAVVAVAVLRDDNRTPHVTTTPEVGWQKVPPSPLGPRSNPVTVWTGREVIVWGGYRGSANGVPLAFQSGAAYNPATNTWRRIADGPWAHPGGMGVWTGSRMVVAAKTGAAEYDPKTNRWRELARLPDDSGGFIGLAAVNGKVLAAVYGAQPGTIAIATYDAAHDAWSVGATTRANLTNDNALTVWTGNELVAWDGSKHGWAYDPARDSWRVLPQFPAMGAANSSLNDQLVSVVDQHTALLPLQLADDHWEPIADPQLLSGIASVRSVDDAGGGIVVLDRTGHGQPYRLDPNRKWTLLDDYPLKLGKEPTAVETDDGLFVWGGQPAGTPPTFANPAPNEPDAALLTIR